MTTITAIGNLVRDADHRLVSGHDLVTATLASNHKHKNKAGEWKTETTFIDIEAWGLIGQDLQTLKKGAGVCVVGTLRQTEWEDKATGVKRSRHYIRPTRILSLQRREPRDTQHPTSTHHDEIPDYTEDTPF